MSTFRTTEENLKGDSLLDRLEKATAKGKGKSRRKPKEPACSFCDGYGNIVEEDGARPCLCQKNDILRRKLEAAQIPKRYINKGLDAYQTHSDYQKENHRKATAFLQNYSPENNKGLYIYGTNGAGKTHLVISILKELLAQGYSGLFYNMTTLVNDIKKSFSNASYADSHTINDRLARVDVLVLDDIAAQKKLTPYFMEQLYLIVNGRYEANKTILMTSHLSLEVLEEYIDYAVYSRLYEMVDFFQCSGGDFRVEDRVKSWKKKL